MHSFAYHKPTTLQEASQLLAADEQSRLLAGGQTLIPTLKNRLASPAALIDLKGLCDLDGIQKSGDALIVGALARHDAVATSPLVAEAIPALAGLAGNIGDVQVRNRGTLGGSVANSDPAADYPAALLGLGATVKTTMREIPADAFFVGMFETALKPDEIIVSIAFPLPRRAAYVKFPNPASRYAMVGVFVADTKQGVRVAVTGAAPCVFRWSTAEAALAKSFVPDALGGLKLPSRDLLTDIHGNADYRASLVATMTRRAIAAATG
jgi:carbon-monoxide dehydrogenase medium subunit